MLAAIRQKLALKIMLSLGLLIILLGGTALILITNTLQSHLNSQLLQRGLLVVNTLQQATKQTPEDLQKLVRIIGQQLDIQLAVIVQGESSHVTASTDERFLGKSLNELPLEDFAGDLNRVMQLKKIHFEFDQENGHVLDVSAPILSDDKKNVEGAIMVHLLTRELKASVNELYWRFIAGVVMFAEFLMLTVYLMLRTWVLIPVKKISAVADARRKGNKQFIQINGDDEFSTMAQAINKMVARSDELEVQKSRFVSTVSHELRTPLTSIKGGLSIFLNAFSQSVPDKGLEALKIAQRNAERLSLLVDDLLDMEKINSGKMTINTKPTDLIELIQNALKDAEPYAKQYQVHFDFRKNHDTLMIQVDPFRIQQVLLNLLSNAAKFSSENTSVVVGVAVNGGSARVSVTDTGAGIPDSFREKIFHSFRQADNSDTRAKGGTGLGLYISNVLLMLHGTQLDYTSELGKGSCFFFDLELVH